VREEEGGRERERKERQTNELRVARGANVDNVETTSAGLCSNSVEEARLLVDDNVVR
jgi:hypothetical protein